MYKCSSCPSVMTKRAKSKNEEKSQRILSCNAKEEILLNKKLRFLESTKKQAKASLMFDQRRLYKRFSVKLRRSEVAHAKLFGNRELVRYLSQSFFPNLHTVVTDSSEKAVRVILQNAETFRAISAPCKSQPQLVSPSVAKNHDRRGLQSKEPEAKDQQMLLGTTKEINSQRQDLRRVISATKKVSISNGQTETSQPDVLRCRRSCTADNQKSNRLSNVNYKYHDFLGRMATPEAIGCCILPKERADTNLTGGFPGQKRDSKNKNHHKRRPDSRALFLRLDNIPGRTYSSLDNHMMVNNYSTLNNKVKLFVAKVTALKLDESHPLQDYYSERLLEKLKGKGSANHVFFMDNEQEQNKWNLVGPEINHRSITIKKLDRNFTSKESPLEMLIQEYYNEILTNENLIKRNWPNNNAYAMLTDEGRSALT